MLAVRPARQGSAVKFDLGSVLGCLSQRPNFETALWLEMAPTAFQPCLAGR